jgi:hypothetical protein
MWEILLSARAQPLDGGQAPCAQICAANSARSASREGSSTSATQSPAPQRRPRARSPPRRGAHVGHWQWSIDRMMLRRLGSRHRAIQPPCASDSKHGGLVTEWVRRLLQAAFGAAAAAAAGARQMG